MGQQEEKVITNVFLNEEVLNKLANNYYNLWVLISSLTHCQNQAFAILFTSDYPLKRSIEAVKSSHKEFRKCFISNLISYCDSNEDRVIDTIFLPDKFKELALAPELLWELIAKLEKNKDKAILILLDSDDMFRACFKSLRELTRFIELFPAYEEKARSVFLKPLNFIHAVERLEEGELKDDFKKGADEILNTLISNLLNQKQLDSDKQETIKLILSFLNSEEPLCYQIDKRKMAYEMLSLTLHPERVKQGSTNLCGPATFLMLWLASDPKLCMQQFIELLKTRKTKSPLNLKSSNESQQKDQNFAIIYLSAIKHTSNRVMGYSSSTNFEQSLGVTEPKIVCDWLNKCGFSQITEATIVTNSENAEAAWYHRAFVGGVYYDGHRRFKTLELNLRQAVSDIASGKEIILLVSAQFQLDNGFTSQSKFEKKNIKSVFGMATSHYIVVKELRYDEEKQRIYITAWSQGSEYNSIIDIQEFLEHYQGFISAIPKNKQLSFKELSSPMFFQNVTSVQENNNNDGEDNKKSNLVAR